MRQNRCFFAYLTLTFDLDILESGFLLSVHLAGVTARRVVHLETIRPVNEGAVRYPILKRCFFRIFDLDLWPWHTWILFFFVECPPGRGHGTSYGAFWNDSAGERRRCAVPRFFKPIIKPASSWWPWPLNWRCFFAIYILSWDPDLKRIRVLNPFER